MNNLCIKTLPAHSFFTDFCVYKCNAIYFSSLTNSVKEQLLFPKTVNMYRILLSGLLFLGIFSSSIYSQNCFCDSCPLDIASSDTTTLTIEIQGAANNDLSNPAQGVCGFCLNFDHDFLSDLQVWLTSPAGQTVNIIGPQSFFPNFTPFTVWDICFVPCNDVANPEPGFSPVWNNNQNWGFGLYANSSYYPHSGCLEDFDTGPVNGLWTLTLVDVQQPQYGGTLLDYSLTFCDDTNLECISCDADGGELAPEAVVTCFGDSSLILDLEVAFEGGMYPDTNTYGYIFIISKNDTILDYQAGPNLIGFEEGTYEISGLSYYLQDSLEIPPPNDSLTVTALNDLVELPIAPFCGSLSGNSLEVIILPEPIVVDLSAEICPGDTFSISNMNFDTTGFYSFTIDPQTGCDSLINLDLTVLPEVDTSLLVSICQGEFYIIATDTFFNSGNYSVTLTASSGCDSIVFLDLEVLNPEALIMPASPITCFDNVSVLDASNSTTGSNVSYNWSSNNGIIQGGTDSLTANAILNGNYQLIVEQTGIDGVNVCFDTAQIEVLIDTISPLANAGPDTSFSCTNDTIQLLETSASSGVEIGYTWSGPNAFSSNSLNPFIWQEGTYLFEVIDSTNGCQQSDTVFISADTTSPDLMIIGDTLNCQDTIVPLIGVSNSNDVNFFWTGPNGATFTSDTIFADTSGVYTLTAATPNGCSTFDSIQIIADDSPPQIQATTDTITCSNSTATLNGSSTTAGVAYFWSGPENYESDQAISSTDSPGLYQLLVTAPNFCTSQMTIEVIGDTLAPDLETTSDTINCQRSTGQLSSISSFSNLLYEWTGPLGFTSSAANPMVSTEGEYQLIVTALNSCVAFDTASLFADTISPTINIQGDTSLNCLVNSLSLDASSSSGQAPLVFNWLNNQGDTLSQNATLSTDTPGTFELILWDSSNFCQENSFATITIDTLAPVANGGLDQMLTCTSPTITLDGNPSNSNAPLQYFWYDPSGNLVADSAMLEVNSEGVYTLEVIDSVNNCSSADTVNVSSNADLPNVEIISNAPITCDNPEVLLDGNNSSQGPDIQYLWENFVGDSLGNTLTLTTNVGGIFTLIAMDTSNGCTAFSSIVVETNLDTPSVVIQGSNGILDCVQKEITLEGVTNINEDSTLFSWTLLPSGNLGNEDTINISQNGIYQLEITNIENGCTGRDSFIVLQNDIIPEASILSTDTITCLNSSIMLNAQVLPDTFTSILEWQDASGNSIGNTPSINTETSGTYSFIASYLENGCNDTASVEVIEQLQEPVFEINASDSLLTCAQPDLDLVAHIESQEGSLQFEWQDENGNTISNDTLLSISDPGFYYFTTTNVTTGCSRSDSLLITQDTMLPIANAGRDTILTCNSPNTILDGGMSSIGTDFNYEWTNLQGTPISNDLSVLIESPDTFLLIVTNTDNGCENTDTVIVSATADFPEAIIQFDGELNCQTSELTLDGALSTSPSGNINYEWYFNGQLIGENNSYQADTSGVYQLTVIDTATGCSSTSSIILNENTTLPTINILGDSILTCTLDSLQLIAESSIDSMLSIIWYSENNATLSQSSSLTIFTPQKYFLQITNMENGCAAIDSIEITIDTLAPQPVISGMDTLNCLTEEVILFGQASITSGSPQFYWSDESGMLLGEEDSILVNSGGSYFLNVTDSQNGCSSENSIFIVTDTIAPNADIQQIGSLNCTEDLVLLDGNNSTPSALLEFQWINPAGQLLGSDEQLNISQAGIYSLAVGRTDNGCLDSVTISVSIDTFPPSFELTMPDTLNCSTDTVTLMVHPFENQYLFDWVSSSGSVISDDTIVNVTEAGWYFIELIDTGNNCTIVDSTLVVKDTSGVPVFDLIQPEQLSCKDSLTSLEASLPAGMNNYLYNWTNSSGDTLFSNTNIVQVNQTGVYSLEVFDTLSQCKETALVEVQGNYEAPSINIVQPLPITCNQPNSILDASNSVTIGTAIYTWTDTSGSLISEDSLAIAIQAGTYYLTLEDAANGCTESDSVVVNSINNQPIATASVEGELNCTFQDIQLLSEGSSSGNHSYLWYSLTTQVIVSETPDASTDQAGIYTLTVTDTLTGCFSQDTIEIIPNQEAPEALVDPGISLFLNCNQPSITLNGQSSQPLGQLIYFWTFESDTLSLEDTLLIDEEGIYTLLVQDTTNFCVDSLSVEVEDQFDYPSINIATPDTISCSRNSVIIDATMSSSGIFDWSGPEIIGDSNKSQINVGAPGWYIIELTNTLSGCSAQDSVRVEADTISPTALITQIGSADCLDSTVILSASGSDIGPDFKLEWSTTTGTILNGEKQLEAEVLAGDTYALIITNQENGCSSTSVITIPYQINQPTGFIRAEQPTCFEGKDGRILIDSILGGSPPYFLSINNGPFVLNQLTYSNLKAGEYTIHVQDSKGCEWSETLILEQPEGLIVTLGENEEIFLGESIELVAQVNKPDFELVRIEWRYPEGKICTDSIYRPCRVVVDTPLENKTYWVIVEDSSGCVADAFVQINVRKDRELFVPNVFSPNGDGMNDVFFISAGSDVSKINKFQVFTRWGELVYSLENFQPNDKRIGWDGRHNGQFLNPGVYVYLLEIEYIDGNSEIIYGDITLRR